MDDWRAWIREIAYGLPSLRTGYDEGEHTHECTQPACRHLYLRCLRNGGGAAQIHEQSSADYGVGMLSTDTATIGFQNAICRGDLGACAGHAGSLPEEPLRTLAGRT